MLGFLRLCDEVGMFPTNGMVFPGRAWFSVVLLCGGTLLGTGCGSSSSGPDGLATAAVSGKVTRQGQPVSGGTVMFNPRASADKKGPPGKPAAGEVGPDGTFKLTTYVMNDGAVIGKHQVTYSAPPIEIDEAQHTENSKPVASPFDGLKPSKPEAEVKAGPNTIDIELVPN